MEADKLIASFAALAHKDGEKWLADRKANVEGEELDYNELVGTLTTDLRTKMQTLGKDKRGQGVSEASKVWTQALKSTFPDVEFNSTQASDVAEALKGFYANSIESVKAQFEDLPTSVDALDAETVRNHPAFAEAVREHVAKNDAKIQAFKAEKDKAIAEYEAKVNQLALKTRRSALSRSIVSAAHEMGVDLGDPTRDKDGYNRRVNMLMHLPDFDPAKWSEDESGQLIPLDADGNHRQNEDFNKMSIVDVLATVNPFGVKKHDPSKGSPSTPGIGGKAQRIDTASFMAQREKLLKAGDKKGALELSKKFAAQATS